MSPIPLQDFRYQSDVEHYGLLALPENAAHPVPGVLIAHAWAGLDDFVKEKAQKLAALGYAAIALDTYGEGKQGHSVEENTQLIAPLLEDRALLRQRLLAGFKAAQAFEAIDANKLAAIGYCFGGLCTLDLARSGADIKGIVSFHGVFTSLPDAVPTDKILAKVLALHGYNDPMVSPEAMTAFMAEMDAGQVDWQLHAYGNTYHAFTKPGEENNDLGLHYSASADRRSWQSMCQFLEEVLV